MYSKYSVFLFCIFTLTIAFTSSQSLAEIAQQIEPDNTIDSDLAGNPIWSADGRWVAVGTNRGQVKIFDVENLAQSPFVIDGGMTIAFHPSDSLLATDAAVWNVASMERVFEYGQVDYVTFSPDGDYFLAANHDNDRTYFNIWQAYTGELVQSFTVETTYTLGHVVFSTGTNRVALFFKNSSDAAQQIPLVQIRDIVDNDVVIELPIFFYEYGGGTHLSHDGRYLSIIKTSIDYEIMLTEVQIWDVETQQMIISETSYDEPQARLSADNHWILMQPPTTIYSTEKDARLNLQFDGLRLQSTIINDNYIVSTYDQFQGDVSDYGFLVWRIDNLTENPNPTMKIVIETVMNNPQGFNDIIFSPDGENLLLSYGETITMWDLETGNAAQLALPDAGLMRFLDDGNYLAVRDSNNMMADGSERIWEIESGALVKTRAVSDLQEFHSPDGIHTATMSNDTLTITSGLTGEQIAFSILDNYLGEVALVDTENGLAIFKDRDLHVYDLNTYEHRLTVAGDADFTLSDDGSYLAVYGDDEDMIQVTIYNLDHIDIPPITLDARFSQNDEFTTAFIPNETKALIIAASYVQDEGFVTHYHLINLETGVEINQWEQDTHAFAFYAPLVTFSATGDSLLIGGNTENNEIVIVRWDVASLENNAPTPSALLQLVIYGYLPQPSYMSFIPDGNLLTFLMYYPIIGEEGYQTYIFPWESILAATETIDVNNFSSIQASSASIYFVSDNRAIFNHKWDGLSVMNIETGEIIFSVASSQYTTHSVSPNGELLIAQTDSGQIIIWELEAFLNQNTTPLYTFDVPGSDLVGFGSASDRFYTQTLYGVQEYSVSR